ncbi:helix-turn-helix domain-containing protein [Actinomadura rugatobispora]|uniref:Helix-turn-helix domain-containing protein n=1 Tax=Actinomadura rugatobispora TaxID=1994 RepID=A0ABW0ZUY0_9ACTN
MRQVLVLRVTTEPPASPWRPERGGRGQPERSARVPGHPTSWPPDAPSSLRREEVALLAGFSIDYYTRLEKGNLSGVSESVLDAVARALQLDEAEHAHLHDLARAANTRPGRARPADGGRRCGPASSGSWMPWPPRPHSSARGAWTS